MERLTKRKEENGQRWIELRCCADCSECCDCEDIWMALDRLAAYEDTGLTPEEIKTLQELHDFYNSKDCLASRRLVELALADKDGRLVVLPCKPNERWIGEQGEIVVIKIVTDWTGTYVHYRYKGKREVCCCNPTYFAIHFTREEAEAALRKEQSDER